jgi:hypothetical protein
MNLFECEVCGNNEPQTHEELVEHILNTHTDYTEYDAEYFSNLWEEDRLEQQDADDVTWYGN